MQGQELLNAALKKIGMLVLALDDCDERNHNLSNALQSALETIKQYEVTEEENEELEGPEQG